MLKIRPATPSDIPEILMLIRELAEAGQGGGYLRARGMDFRSNWQHLL
jgi:hypothetical protein